MAAFILKQTQSKYINIFNKSSSNLNSIKTAKYEHRFLTKSLRNNRNFITTLNLINHHNRPWNRQERYTNTSSAHSKLTPSFQPTNLNRTPHRFNDLIKKPNITWITFRFNNDAIMEPSGWTRSKTRSLISKPNFVWNLSRLRHEDA